MDRLVCLIHKKDHDQFFCMVKGNNYLNGSHILEETLEATEMVRWTPDKDFWHIHDLAPDKLTGWLE